MRQSQYMSANDIKYLVLHCSASRCNQDYSVELLRTTIKARGFYDIGYHFYIQRMEEDAAQNVAGSRGALHSLIIDVTLASAMRGGLDEMASLPIRSPKNRRSESLICSSISISFFPKAKIVGHRDLPSASPKGVQYFVLMLSLDGLRICNYSSAMASKETSVYLYGSTADIWFHLPMVRTR